MGRENSQAELRAAGWEISQTKAERSRVLLSIPPSKNQRRTDPLKPAMVGHGYSPPSREITDS